MSRRKAPPGAHELRACLAVSVIAGFLLRAALAIAWPAVQRPDETFQNLEPAYRLLSGWGVRTWEWRDGIRSFLFPDLLAAIMRAARLLHLPLLPAIAIVLSAVATGAVVVGVLVGWRRMGRSGALLCGILCAIWPDLVYFGPKPLLEVQAGNLLVIAAGLASLDRARAPIRLATIGLLLGLAFDLRFQLAPGLAVVAIGAARRDLRSWLLLLAAAAIPLALLGVVDWLTWGSPFQSIWKNVDVNLFQNRATTYGVEPVYWYATATIHRYGLVSVPLALCFGLGIRSAPLLALTAFVVVAFHSLIAHKEFSFIYAAIPCAVIVAGLGAARLLATLSRQRAPALACAMLACAAMAALAGRAERPFHEPGEQPDLRALWSILHQRADFCGLGLYAATQFPWWLTPGYVRLQRDVPIYLLQGPAELSRAAPGFNYLVVDTASLPTLPAGERVACVGKFCLLHRNQPCVPVAGLDFNSVLEREGK